MSVPEMSGPKSSSVCGGEVARRPAEAWQQLIGPRPRTLAMDSWTTALPTLAPAAPRARCRVQDKDVKYYANGEDAYEMRKWLKGQPPPPGGPKKAHSGGGAA